MVNIVPLDYNTLKSTVQDIINKDLALPTIKGYRTKAKKQGNLHMYSAYGLAQDYYRTLN